MGSIDLCDPSKRTICELNCRLVHVDADSTAEVVGLTYPCVRVTAPEPSPQDDSQPFKDAPVYARECDAVTEAWYSAADGLFQVSGPLKKPLKALYEWLLGYGLRSSALLRPPSPQLSPHVGVPPLAWHPHTPVLAVAVSGASAAGTRGAVVNVYDMPNGERMGSTAVTAATGSVASISSPSCSLSHPLQPHVWSLAWRPNRGTQLAVGTTGRVLLWCTSAATKPPAHLRQLPGKPGGPWVMSLETGARKARYTSLAWCPQGRLLVAASPDLPGMTLWDVTTGDSTQIGCGLSALTMLRFSPCGGYLFAAGAGAHFHLWETSTWQYASWSAPPDRGPVVQAAWAPFSDPSSDTSPAPYGGAAPAATGRRVVLLSFEEGGGALVALYLVREPPALVAQMQPVVLQDMSLRTLVPASALQQPSTTSETVMNSIPVVRDWWWDARGERLVVLLGAPHPAAGCLAVYATDTATVVEARLLGYARPPPGVVLGDTAGQWRGSVVSYDGFSKGAYSRGALFSVRTVSDPLSTNRDSDTVYNLPMYYN